MSQMYYFEPLEQLMSEYQVASNIGSIVLKWDESRQNELGLFKAYQTPYPTNYGRFTNKVTGSSWVRKGPGENANLPPFDQSQYPTYVQEWVIEPLDEAEQDALREVAENVVATEIESRLASANAWASAKHIANTSTPVSNGVKNYINDLFALNGSVHYPFTLADEAENGSYTNWPYKLSTRELYQLVDPA